MFTINYTCHRNNTSAPFWHDSPEGLPYSEVVQTLRESGAYGTVEYSNFTSPDGLEYISTYIFETQQDLVNLTNETFVQLPDFGEARAIYFLNHGHSFVLTGTDDQGNITEFNRVDN